MEFQIFCGISNLDQYDFDDYWISELRFARGQKKYFDFGSLETSLIKTCLVGKFSIDFDASRKYQFIN